MIRDYYRPQTLDEALTLLSQPDTLPLGGGTVLTQSKPTIVSVVDLQALGLNKLRKAGNNLEIGATVTLQQLLESEHTPPALKQAIQLEAPLNIRDVATVAGALVACDGRSPFAVAMLALDAQVTVNGQGSTVNSLGNILPLRTDLLDGKLITQITIPLQAQLMYEQVARTPDDKPILCTAMSMWPSKRTRLVLGGWGKSPSLAMDGKEPGGYETAARHAAHDATDPWASAEYRADVAAKLAKRCFETTNSF
jgi:CO/xanthine dehydrogenase FAD-binding subunit